MISMKENIEKTVQWLKQQVKLANASGLIVGVSGGIDSALVAYLIKKACPDNSLGVIMPIKSSPKDREDALMLVKACDIKYLDIELSSVHNDLFENVLTQMKKENLYIDENKKMADANLRARIRMSTLYTIANNLNYLVVGTDNKAEVYTGYYTKYGDGGVDILPIANITKAQVYEWSKYLGVPNAIIDRSPSAGLWEGQTDENEMGTTYNMIDAYISGREIPQKDKEIIDRLHKRTEHKRQTPPKPPIFD